MDYDKYIREPTKSELDFFKNNLNVGGYASPDNKIVHNPYKKLNPQERFGITINEGTRLFLRNNPLYQQILTNYANTEKQKQTLNSYSKNQQDINDTIAGRFMSNDPSINDYTLEQKIKLNLLKILMNNNIGNTNF